MEKDNKQFWHQLRKNFTGEIYTDNTHRILYATDASAYREHPMGVVRPKHINDLQQLIFLANEFKIPLIPRTAGTSLAGQVVGNGLVVDVSKHLTSILEVNPDESWIRVQPGVVLDELNKYLANYDLFFGPETSTSNRCMMGGMVGNNSCGAHSLIYGSTRDHTLEIKGYLSNGDFVHFKPLTNSEFAEKCQLENEEGKIYRSIKEMLTNPDNGAEIRKEFPHSEINRRNTGYAIDLLLESEPFTASGKPFNFCQLIAGSEGTLMFITEIKLNLVPTPPKRKAVVCAHFNSLEEAFRGNLIALKYNPGAVEMMDKTIMDLTKDNITQRKNRFFVEGDPAALLLIEFARKTEKEIKEIAHKMEQDFRDAKMGYAFPIVFGQNINRIWALRKAGLGVLANMPGDAKPAPVIEDTAVRPTDLPDYMDDFNAMLKKYGKDCVYYAHIGTGELHLRPVLNLKLEEDVEAFRNIAHDTAVLVKKYRGSLSGEHGDGRLRGEFIPLMIGDKNYELIKQVKQIFDPNNILNPDKIVNTPSMNSSLRFEAGKPTRELDTIFDWSSTMGMTRAAEKCNGSGDCRKSEIIGGTMCPSYMGSRDERNTTRARANILREFLNRSEKENPLNHKEIYDVLDLCLSCKACKSECPSNVDMTKLKAEFLQFYYNSNGIPLRSKIIAYTPLFNKWLMPFQFFYNVKMTTPGISHLIRAILGFASKRSLPKLSKITLKKWARKHSTINGKNRRVYLFADEFTNFNESEIGIKTILLLNKLGYDVVIPEHIESGRTFLSKGLLKKAQEIAQKNISLLAEIITEESPLIGIEPSALLTFRDEYPDLVGEEQKKRAQQLAANSLLLDEFLDREMKAGNIVKEQFTEEKKEIKFHGHCYQKALAETSCTQRVLSFPVNYEAIEIPSGCCGMAGAFGYEKEHYELSQKIGELVLLPEVRNTPESVLISAAGTSCRHQIKDGTDRKALHTAEVLFEALK
ncbi:FAD-binding oxidoreductase [Prolixibacteraceae bacterium JC049]|nr:FAD-binding oxidoreductase [Prolixibacteraceae bacterium JC049]